MNKQKLQSINDACFSVNAMFDEGNMSLGYKYSTSNTHQLLVWVYMYTNVSSLAVDSDWVGGGDGDVRLGVRMSQRLYTLFSLDFTSVVSNYIIYYDACLVVPGFTTFTYYFKRIECIGMFLFVPL